MSLSLAQSTFAARLVAEAKASGHPFPGYAAAEAALESGWGQSGLTQHTNDVFGLKEPSWWTGQVYDEQTLEVFKGVSEMVDAKWPVFASLSDAFAARLHTLQSLPGTYGEALQAQDGAEFVRLVSGYWVPATSNDRIHGIGVFNFPSGYWRFVTPPPCRWSTAPDRAIQVLNTYRSHPEIFGA